MTRPSLLSLLLLAGCARQRVEEFNVMTINQEKKQVPCVILLDDSFVYADNSSQSHLVTPIKLKIKFEKANNEYGYRSVKLGVKAVPTDASGKTPQTVRPRDRSPYFEEFRHLYPNFPKNQLFILVDDPSWQGRPGEPSR
jgi:hypothetical protein